MNTLYTFTYQVDLVLFLNREADNGDDGGDWLKTIVGMRDIPK